MPANQGLLPSVTTTSTALNASADKLEESTKGIFEFLLLNSRGFRLLVRDAHAATKDRLVGKAQLRMPATSRTDAFPPGRSEQLARYRHGRVCWLPFETADFQESEGREC